MCECNVFDGLLDLIAWISGETQQLGMSENNKSKIITCVVVYTHTHTYKPAA